jgi:multidrug efflux pump subunit AcrA (membrane-fusion protein)
MNKVSIKTVLMGPRFADLWVVNSGLQAGENVIVDGKSGMIVAPTPYKNTQAAAVAGEN